MLVWTKVEDQLECASMKKLNCVYEELNFCQGE